jgi:sialidase-1
MLSKDAVGGPLEQADLYVGGQGGYQTYRIPAVVVSTKGTVLAFCEGRKYGAGDAGEIDLLLRRSTDGGKTFSKQQVVWHDRGNTCGNPCPVVDRTTGAVLLLMTHNLGEDAEWKILDLKSKGTRTVWISKSVDDGLSWSQPVDITRSTKDPHWAWYATGPGAGVQLASGRLLVPCDHSDPRTRTFHSHVIYSDEHGENWRLGGRTGPGANECEAVELAGGALLLNSRNAGGKGCRAISLSRDQGLSWSKLSYDKTLVEPTCQGSIRRYATAAGDGKSRILFSNPAHKNQRVGLTVRLSYDECRTWPVRKVLYAGPAAYSCLAEAADGTILDLYERGERDPYQKISLARFKLDWLTEGQ